MSAIFVGYLKYQNLLHLKGFSLLDWLVINVTLKAFVILLFYWLLYSAITEHMLGLIALLLLGLMYGLNHYVISNNIIII